MITNQNETTLRTWDAIHAVGFVTLACALAVFSESLAAMSIESQLIVLLAGTLVLGIPHGALDLPVARSWLAPRLGWTWLPIFSTAYLAVAAPVALGWVFFPTATLAFFLVTAVIHFAVSDTLEQRLPPWRRVLEGLARGAAPIAGAARFWPEEVTGLFNILVSFSASSNAGAALQEICAAAWLPALIGIALAAILRAFDALSGDLRALTKAAELMSLPIVFSALPPLLAFAAYWVGLHSLHVMLLSAAQTQRGLAAGLTSVFKRSVPATLISFIGAGVIYFLAFQSSGPVEGAVSILFMGLASLNTPHMLFVLIASSIAQPDHRTS